LFKGRVDGVILLGHGEIKYALDVKVNQISKSAREKIEAAGGKVEVL
jgi:large subunit ribosomal protein L15